MSLPDILQQYKPSVVMVASETHHPELPITGEYVRHNRMPSLILESIEDEVGPIWSKGTGFVLNAEKGLVGTAFHVVEDCPENGIMVIYALWTIIYRL